MHGMIFEQIATGFEFECISTLAAAALRQMGFMRAVALHGGVKSWREGGYRVTEPEAK